MNDLFGNWGLSNIEKSRIFWAGIGFWAAILIAKLTEDKNEKTIIAVAAVASMILATQIMY